MSRGKRKKKEEIPTLLRSSFALYLGRRGVGLKRGTALHGEEQVHLAILLVENIVKGLAKSLHATVILQCSVYGGADEGHVKFTNVRHEVISRLPFL